MRTKTLILSAVLSAAGIASSLAQVYSVNAVGYVNVTVPAGPGAFVAAGNPLNYPDGTNPANTLDNILPNAPNNTTKVWDFDPATGIFALYTKRATGWSGAAGVNFNPGKGFFIQNDLPNPITLTFVGEVPQGTKTVAYTAGFNLIASAFPLSGGLESFLGYPAVNGDKVYQLTLLRSNTRSTLAGRQHGVRQSRILELTQRMRMLPKVFSSRLSARGAGPGRSPLINVELKISSSPYQIKS